MLREPIVDARPTAPPPPNRLRSPPPPNHHRTPPPPPPDVHNSNKQFSIGKPDLKACKIIQKKILITDLLCVGVQSTLFDVRFHNGSGTDTSTRWSRILCIVHGWLVTCFGLYGPLRQYFGLYRAVTQREGERKEK